MSKRTKLIILSITILLLGFLRDYLFMNTNEAFGVVQSNLTFHGRDEFEFMLDWSIQTFVIVKWIGSAVFFGLFALFTWLIVKIAFDNPIYSRISVFLYLGLLAISGVLFAIGSLAGWTQGLYGILHTIVMFAQSFTPLIILVLLFRFFPKQDQQTS